MVQEEEDTVEGKHSCPAMQKKKTPQQNKKLNMLGDNFSGHSPTVKDAYKGLYLAIKTSEKYGVRTSSKNS